MYFTVSTNLMGSSPSDKSDLIVIDRSIAASFSPSGYGWLDEGILHLRTGLQGARLNNFIRRYERVNVIKKYIALECPNGHLFDPSETECPKCGVLSTKSTLSSSVRYRVEAQPQQPVFDPATAQGPFSIFLSYRHSDKERLAADAYYSFLAHNQHSFIDGGDIPPGRGYEDIFLKAASDTPHFICMASPSYFDSPYCKKELAHALRMARNIVLISVDGGFSPPSDMPWLARMHPSNINGTINGLSKELEAYLLTQVMQHPTPRNYDFQLEACSYLLAQLGEGELTRVISSLSWLRRIAYKGVSMDDLTVTIQREIGNDRTKLQELCAALAP